VIVVDASALTELLVQTELGSRVEARLFRGADDLHTPHLLDAKIVQALRRLVRAGRL
jgi:predicted nucleic acid-binding protein